MRALRKRVEVQKGERLVLGTVQLGMPYGIANRTGQPDFETALAIINTAWEHGIREFDTAHAYGESEAVLGRAFSYLGISSDVKVITKLDPQIAPSQREDIQRAVAKSLDRLKIPTFYGLLLHREDWVDNLNHTLKEALQDLVSQGTVHHLGVSHYTPAKALQTLASDFFGMIQVPANILDHRFAAAGVFDLAREANKQVYIRSVFLQGLLLMKPENLPASMAFAKPALNIIDRLCSRYQCSRQKAALLYIKWRYPQARIIVGAETPAQLEETLNIWQDSLSPVLEIEEFASWPMVDEKIINPSLWP